MSSLVVDGEADDLEAVRAAQHLAVCPSCRRFHAFADRAGAILRAEEDGDERLPSRVAHPRARQQAVSMREHELAIRLASHMMRDQAARDARSTTRASAPAVVALIATLSLGVFIGGFGVWTIVQPSGSDMVQQVPGSPRITASRTLDPGTDVDRRVSILASWVPPRRGDDPYWEKRMMGLTPMSLWDELHYRPDNL